MRQLVAIVRGVMSLHKLSAGDGYTYLTRQVAAQDVTARGRGGLGEYYAERGESPGVWLGGGLVGMGPVVAGSVVTEAQMVALFGEGRHPDALAIEAELIAAGHGVPVVLAATRLGSPYPQPTPTPATTPSFQQRLAERYAAVNVAAGRPARAPLGEPERARVRTELARELFAERHGRAPADARELSGFVARASRPAAGAVAGYDLTFTPVKSVSALWAVAPRGQAQVVEHCHQAAVRDVLGWLETEAGWTRLGRGGVRQVKVRGLIGVAFTHRDSRAGDPNLHTHVAVSNKVQVAGGPQAGQWTALDGRPLHALAVAASERYNTRLEALLTDRLGVRFAGRPGVPLGGGPGRRAVREVVGVDERLTAEWSSRRAVIDVRRAELAARFLAEHGRVPAPVEALRLAQQATLETRQGKHEPRSHEQQRATWRQQAVAVLGGATRLDAMLSAVLGRGSVQRPGVLPAAEPVPAGWVADTAERVLQVVQSSRATWRQAHVRAEAERQARAANLTLGQVDVAVERVVAAVLSPALSIPLSTPEPAAVIAAEPSVLRRADGSSVYATTHSQQYTSAAVLGAERTLLELAQQRDGRRLSAGTVQQALDRSARAGRSLNAGQAGLVHELASSGARVQVVLAPAGTGKTTALAVLAAAWTADGGTVVGLAPSAAAAAVLGGELSAGVGERVVSETLAKLVWSLPAASHDLPGDGTDAGGPTGPGTPPAIPDWVSRIGPDALVIVDEAGMAGTIELARAVGFLTARGASVRLVGDDSQLAAVGAGGALTDLARTAGAVTLDQVVRFSDPVEGAASLALRAGDPAALGFYLDHGRIHVGNVDDSAEQAYSAWAADRAAGLDALLLAPTHELVAALNARARADRLAGASGSGAADDGSGRADGPSSPREVPLGDGLRASAGDTVLTRRNDRRLVTAGGSWVRNGDRWRVLGVRDDGDLLVQDLTGARRVLLPASYVAEHVTLGYASTIHTAQGSTADACHTVLTGGETRQLLYVGLTRGRTSNHAYLTTIDTGGGEHDVLAPEALRPPTAVEQLAAVLHRDGAPLSATSTRQALTDPAGLLGPAAARYLDSLAVAAEQHLGPAGLAQLDQTAERAVPGVTSCAAYPALRARLALLSADRHDPAQVLAGALAAGPLHSARDVAAVLDSRLDLQARPRPDLARRPGPLPWLPAVPAALSVDPIWGRYLHARAAHVAHLAAQVRSDAAGWTGITGSVWADGLLADPQKPHADLLGRLAVWRAAQQIEPDDARPTGPPQVATAERRAQHPLDSDLDAALHGRRPMGTAAGGGTWQAKLEGAQPQLLTDPAWPGLRQHLAIAQQAGADIPSLLQTAAARGPLPDELPAAALRWRLHPYLSQHPHQPERLERLQPPHDAGPALPGALTAAPSDPPPAERALPAPGARWRKLAAGIDPRLIRGPDWAGLAAALDRADRAGYDLARHLPRLADGELPDTAPARALHSRLAAQCPAAHTPLRTAAQQIDDSSRTLAARERLAQAGREHDNLHRRAATKTGTSPTATAREQAPPVPTPPTALARPAGRPR